MRQRECWWCRQHVFVRGTIIYWSFATFAGLCWLVSQLRNGDPVEWSDLGAFIALGVIVGAFGFLWPLCVAIALVQDDNDCWRR